MYFFIFIFIFISSAFSNSQGFIQTNPGEVTIYYQLTKIGTSDKSGYFKLNPDILNRMKNSTTKVKLSFQKKGYFKVYKPYSISTNLQVTLLSFFDFFDLVEVPAGTFTMGRQDSEYNRWFEKPQHKVTISSSFYMGRYEVTQKQWKAIFHRTNSHVKKDELPVENVSWIHIQKFLTKLNKMAGCNTPNTLKTIQKSGLGAIDSGCYRLPTEAEWEYAARGGSDTAFSFGDVILAKDANFDIKNPYGIKGIKLPQLTPKARFLLSNKPLKSVPGGQFKANAFGLYDMHGNVAEWVIDWFDTKFYTNGDVIDPVNTTKSRSKVIRGGGWTSWGRDLRSATRFDLSPKHKDKAIGFRLVLVK